MPLGTEELLTAFLPSLLPLETTKETVGVVMVMAQDVANVPIVNSPRLVPPTGVDIVPQPVVPVTNGTVPPKISRPRKPCWLVLGLYPV